MWETIPNGTTGIGTFAGIGGTTSRWVWRGQTGFIVYNNDAIWKDSFRVDIAIGDSTGVLNTLGSFFINEGVAYKNTAANGSYIWNSDSPGAHGTLCFRIARVDANTKIENNYSAGSINQYDSFICIIDGYRGSPATLTVTKQFQIFMPNHATGTSAWYYVDNSGRSYTTFSFGSIACGVRHQANDTTSMALSDTRPVLGLRDFSDSMGISESIRLNRRYYPIQRLAITDDIEYISVRHGTITNWHFAPSYKLMFNDNPQSLVDNNSYGTTSWNSRVQSWGNIRKSIRHWSGEWEVGEWNPVLADVDNVLFGSFYSGTKDVRGKDILMSAFINTNPITFTPQFSGQVTKTDWSDGLVTLSIQDKLFGLPNRAFVFDYVNLGTRQTNVGIVKRIFGTLVMFDDAGSISYIQRKKKGVSVWESIGAAVMGGVVGFIKGGWLGAGIGAAAGFAGNAPVGDKVVGGYYKIDDFNAIPDDIVMSGVKLKFFPGSVNPIATNSSGVLFRAVERSITSGTFINGLYGTFTFDDISGIREGDYVYVRRPITYSGSPDEIIKAILCGSNIDRRYSSGSLLGIDTSWGRQDWLEVDSFSSEWKSEIAAYSPMVIGNIIGADDVTTPFEQIKLISSELGFSFFLDEENKFSIKSPAQPDIFVGNEATYTQGANILDGFKFSRSSDEAISGVRFYYGYSGNNVGGVKEGYSSMIEVASSSPITGIESWMEVSSKWVRDYDDARVIANRFLIDKQSGYDRIHLPTTLYGLPQSLTDLIRVTHTTGSLTNQLFEIESYDKQYDESRVDIEAYGVARTFGQGVCRWRGTFAPVSSSDNSGFAYSGPIGSLTNIGSIAGTLNAFGDRISVYNWTGLQAYSGQVIVFGSLSGRFSEVAIVTLVYQGTMYLQRGLFNTIKRRYFPNESIYLAGITPITPLAGTWLVRPDNIEGTSYRFGTTTHINTNIGTSFKVW